jgi:hypothetical protein
VKLVHLVGFIIKKFVTMDGHTNVKFLLVEFIKVELSILVLRGVISKVLHTVRFLFKNEFIVQNTFTGLQCNLHCALSGRSNVWVSLVFLSGRLRC